jgi:hypothetical protein
VTRREGDDLVTDVLETFDFRGEENCVGRRSPPALIQSCDADWISSGDDPISSIANIMQDKAEESVQFRGDVHIDLIVLLSANLKKTYKMKNNLAIRMSLELMRVLETLPQCTMVINLSIDSQD